MPSARILLVEDDSAHRATLAALLAAYDVTAVGSLEEARSVLASALPFDAAILDLCLPDGRGSSLALPPRTTVILISGDPDPPESQRPWQERAWQLLYKPIDAQQFLYFVGMAVRLNGIRPSPPRGIPRVCP